MQGSYKDIKSWRNLSPQDIFDAFGVQIQFVLDYFHCKSINELPGFQNVPEKVSTKQFVLAILMCVFDGIEIPSQLDRLIDKEHIAYKELLEFCKKSNNYTYVAFEVFYMGIAYPLDPETFEDVYGVPLNTRGITYISARQYYNKKL